MKGLPQYLAYRRFCVQCDAELVRVDYGRWACVQCFGAGLINGRFDALALARSATASADGPPGPAPFSPWWPPLERPFTFDFDFLNYKNRWRKNKPWAPPRLPGPPSLRVGLAEFFPAELRAA